MLYGRRLLLLILAVSFLTGASPLTPVSSPVATVSSPMDIATADNTFGFRLLNAVQKTLPNGNVVLSPVSAALNLSMVLNGAEGQTKDEMLKALSLGGSEIDAVNTANAQLIKTIRGQTDSVTLSVADSLWVDSRRATLRPDYMKRMQTSYAAEVEGLDFSNPDVPRQINGWASKQT
jgi:serine protease inhibitor